MQGGKYRSGAKALLDRKRAQFSRPRTAAGKAENRVRGAENARPCAESLAQHAHGARRVAKVERFPFREAVTECGHDQRSVAANRDLDGFDPQIQTLFLT